MLNFGNVSTSDSGRMEEKTLRKSVAEVQAWCLILGNSSWAKS